MLSGHQTHKLLTHATGAFVALGFIVDAIPTPHVANGSNTGMTVRAEPNDG
jgi:hypothetical protein